MVSAATREIVVPPRDTVDLDHVSVMTIPMELVVVDMLETASVKTAVTAVLNMDTVSNALLPLLL